MDRRDEPVGKVIVGRDRGGAAVQQAQARSGRAQSDTDALAPIALGRLGVLDDDPQTVAREPRADRDLDMRIL